MVLISVISVYNMASVYTCMWINSREWESILFGSLSTPDAFYLLTILILFFSVARSQISLQSGHPIPESNPTINVSLYKSYTGLFSRL